MARWEVGGNEGVRRRYSLTCEDGVLSVLGSERTEEVDLLLPFLFLSACFFFSFTARSSYLAFPLAWAQRAILIVQMSYRLEDVTINSSVRAVRDVVCAPAIGVASHFVRR